MTLMTPRLDGPIVPGIMRGLVLEHARELAAGGLAKSAVSRRVELDGADEVFLTNSVRGILPVRRALGGGPGFAPWNWPAPGPWTQRLWGKVSNWLHQGGTTA